MRMYRRGAARILAVAGVLSLTACVGTKENPVEPEAADPDDPPTDVRMPPGEGGTVPPPPAGAQLRG